MKYRVRCSQLSTLLDGCGKVRGKLEWKDLSKMSESHIKLAVEIFNASRGFVSQQVQTLDMIAGIEHEPGAVRMLDDFRNTQYYDQYNIVRNLNAPFEKSNDWLTGTRDVGNEKETIDIKVSTDKNVFDVKRFAKIEPRYIIQLNGYGMLYGTDDLYLANILMPATFGQIHKMVSSESYMSMLTDEMQDMLQDKLERNYSYDHLNLSQRIQIKEVPKIENFEEIVSKRVEVLNTWIKHNLETKYDIF